MELLVAQAYSLILNNKSVNCLRIVGNIGGAHNVYIPHSQKKFCKFIFSPIDIGGGKCIMCLSAQPVATCNNACVTIKRRLSNMKKLLSIILVIVTALGMLTLSACAKHEHEYDTTWHTDATSHWHVCTGDDCEEISDKADHVYDNDCDADCNVCKATRTPAAHVYDHACDTTCNVCNATRTISFYAVGEDPIDCSAGWVGAENITGVADGQYVFKIDEFDSQYAINLTPDRMEWFTTRIDYDKYTRRFFDKDFNELTVDTKYSSDVVFLDKDGKDITENYEGKTIYMMITLKEALTFCPYAN